MEGKVVKIISNLMSVKVNDQVYDCKPRGKFYHLGLTPLVGDQVVIDEVNHYILDIKERKNELSRPSIANIDAAIIVVSVKNPNLSLYMLDKMLTLIIYNKIMPIICFSKTDLLSEDEFKEFKTIFNYYEKIGIKVCLNTELDKLTSFISKKVVVLTGQTGAGKSSLLNKLDPNLNLKTDEISKALGRGKHTTRHTELFDFKDTLIADTPGFSSLNLDNIPKTEIKNTFYEFKNNCKYQDCNHLNENECKVKEAVGKNILKSRYDSYVKMVNEVENIRIIYKK